MKKKLKKVDKLSIILFPSLFFLEYFLSKIMKNKGYEGYSLSVPSFLLNLSFLIFLIYTYKATLKRDWRKYKKNKFKMIFSIVIGVLLLHIILINSRKLLGIKNNVKFLSYGSSLSLSYEEITFTRYIIYIILSMTSLFTATIEEIIFRHILFRKLSEKTNTIIVFLLISSVLFGLIHYFNVKSIYATIPYMFVGLFLALVYLMTDNIMYPLTIHFINNLIVSILPILLMGITRVLGI